MWLRHIRAKILLIAKPTQQTYVRLTEVRSLGVGALLSVSIVCLVAFSSLLIDFLFGFCSPVHGVSVKPLNTRRLIK